MPYVTNDLNNVGTTYCSYSVAPLTRQLLPHDLMYMNFQLCDNERLTKMAFIKRQSYDHRKNILLNRMQILNNLIDKQWLQLSLSTFKIKCKELFLN